MDAIERRERRSLWGAAAVAALIALALVMGAGCEPIQKVALPVQSVGPETVRALLAGRRDVGEAVDQWREAERRLAAMEYEQRLAPYRDKYGNLEIPAAVHRHIQEDYVRRLMQIQRGQSRYVRSQDGLLDSALRLTEAVGETRAQRESEVSRQKAAKGALGAAAGAVGGIVVGREIWTD